MFAQAGPGLPFFILLFIGALVLSFFSVAVLVRYFEHLDIVAVPDDRSMHVRETPVGGGWPVVVLTLVSWIVFSRQGADAVNRAVLAGALVLAILSWTDDRRTLLPVLRLGVQGAVIFSVLALLPGDETVFSSAWPLWTDRVLTGLCWLWFVNLFNFMDGIDGLAGTEIIFICLGFIAIGLQTGLETGILQVATVLAGASAGFLWWNWHPAKIFLGDVGAITIGFVLGWLLIRLAIGGHMIAALLLSACFVADASLTLLKRVLKGEAFWKPHKTHFYQRAAMALGSHSRVVLKVAAANTGLLALALLSPAYPLVALSGGLVIVVAMLVVLQRDAVK